MSHIYFGSYIFEILKVEIEERREPRVKWTFHISFDTNTKPHISRKMSLNKKNRKIKLVDLKVEEGSFSVRNSKTPTPILLFFKETIHLSSNLLPPVW
jgi:hypothetical protein